MGIGEDLKDAALDAAGDIVLELAKRLGSAILDLFGDAKDDSIAEAVARAATEAGLVRAKLELENAIAVGKIPAMTAASYEGAKKVLDAFKTQPMHPLDLNMTMLEPGHVHLIKRPTEEDPAPRCTCGMTHAEFTAIQRGDGIVGEFPKEFDTSDGEP